MCNEFDIWKLKFRSFLINMLLYIEIPRYTSAVNNMKNDEHFHFSKHFGLKINIYNFIHQLYFTIFFIYILQKHLPYMTISIR